MCFFSWKELFMTFDVRAYDRLAQTLEKAGIPYRVKTHYSGNANRRTGMIGSLGERPEFETQYRILVKKRDYERARHLWQQGPNY